MEKFESERNTLFSVILGHTLNVILGFIPRIHTKHTSLDTRVKPEYDKGLRLSNVILEHLANVILGFIPRIHLKHSPMDTRITPKYDGKQSLIKGLDVVCQCAALLERRVQSDTRVRKAQAVTRQTNQIGRSMIEMLGVLAIIGVLSVGGIAGYSKAMEKIHVNKIVNMISDISATIKTAYISQKNYDFFDGGIIGFDNQIQDMGLLPPEYTFEFEGEKRIGLSSPLTLINPLGYTKEYEEGGFSALSIGVLVPQNLCVPLLTYDWRNADMKGIFTHVDLSAPTSLGSGAILYYANIDENGEIHGSVLKNCDENDDEGYVCIETKEQRFRPVSPAAAAKYCKSSAADSFGTGQMYVGFDLLADVKVSRKD